MIRAKDRRPALQDNLPPPTRAPLAVLPNGEAIRADRVTAVRVIEEARLVGGERQRFLVQLELADGQPWTIANDLTKRDAAAIARQAARAVNEALVNGHDKPLA